MANYAVRLPRPNQDISPLKGRGELKNKRKQKKKKSTVSHNTTDICFDVAHPESVRSHLFSTEEKGKVCKT